MMKCRSIRGLQRNSTCKARTLTKDAGDVHRTFHQSDELLANGQTEPHSALSPRGRGLPERVKEMSDLLGPHAISCILDPEAYDALIHSHAHPDLAMVGELDGIDAQVDEDLKQTSAITHHGWGVRRGRHDVESITTRDGKRQDVRLEVIQHLRDVKRVGLQLELVCLDFGQIEQIIEQTHKVTTRLLNRVQITGECIMIDLSIIQRLLEQLRIPHDGGHGRA